MGGTAAEKTGGGVRPEAGEPNGEVGSMSESGGAGARESGTGTGTFTFTGEGGDANGGDAADGMADCDAEPVTLEEIHSGRVRDNVAVQVGPLVASSQKFLVSEAKSGSCLWGAFAAAPGKAGEGAGLLLVSFGDKHAEGASCVSGTDGLPDDLAIGDLLQASGHVQSFVPAACAERAPSLQLVVDARCAVERMGHAAAPEPQTISLDLADKLAAGADAALLRAWGGSLVRLERVTALRDAQDGDGVFPFGVIKLAETALELHSRISYFDLSEGGPRSPEKQLQFHDPSAFDSVTGLVFLDYCSWALGLRSRCADLSPGSENCGPARGP